MRYATALEPASHDATDVVTALATALEQKRGLDIRRGLTHAGPHRDDLTLTLDGRELRAFGSAGQPRPPAIALRLLEGDTLPPRRRPPPPPPPHQPFHHLDPPPSAPVRHA